MDTRDSRSQWSYFPGLLKDLHECLSVCIYVHYMCIWCIQRSEEGIVYSGIGAEDGCELKMDVDTGNRTQSSVKV